ncbi:MAG: sporulation protein YqfD [Clostridiales bacterium]|nr:sporulation protein YqfD [Clostridiales bacterium]
MVVKDTHILDGRVLVHIRGRSPERFLGLCAYHGFIIKNISCCDKECICTMYAEDFLRCRTFARKARVQVHIQKKLGLPFILLRFRRRPGWITGMLFFLVILAGGSHFLWEVELTGGMFHTKDQIMQLLIQEGLHAGIPMDQISSQNLEEDIRIQYPDISWASVEKDGAWLRIRLKENTSYEESLPESEEPVISYEETAAENEKEHTSLEKGYDLVAESDGVIESIVTRQGVPMVKAGDIVKKGTILVSGIVPLLDDSQQTVGAHFCQADADILARVILPYHWETDMYEEKRRFHSLQGIGFSLTILGHRTALSLGSFQSDDIWTVSSDLPLFSSFHLPVRLDLSMSYHPCFIQRRYSKKEMQSLCQKEWEKYSDNLQIMGVQILEKDVKINYGSFCLEMDGTVTVITPFGKQIPSTDPAKEKENQEEV